MNDLTHGGYIHKYNKTHSEEERCDRRGALRTVSAPIVDRNATSNDNIAGSDDRRPRMLIQLFEMAAALQSQPSRARTQPIPVSYRADELDAVSPSDMSLEHNYMSTRPSPHDDDASKRVSRRWRRSRRLWRSANIVSPASSGHAWDAMDGADAENDPHHTHELCSSSWENTLIFEMSM